MSPLAVLPPFVGLLVVSALSTAGTLLLIKVTSHANRIEATKRQLYAALLEMRLFNDDLRAVLRAAGELLSCDVAYLREFVPSILLASIPVAILLVHLDSFYGSTGLVLGQSALITVGLEDSSHDASSESPAATVEVPPGIRLDTLALWFPASREVIWQITPERLGRFELVVKMAGEHVSKRVEVSDAIIRRAPSRTGGTWWADVFSAADQRLASNGVIRSVDVQYPRREMSISGWRVHWLVIFLVSSLIFAVVFKRPLGVVL
jgi:hypothetical protein